MNEEKEITVLSLFDGMSCGQIALNRIGIKPKKYYAAEIDKFAKKITQKNYPDTIQIGDVTNWKNWDIEWDKIDLVTAGFPCQAWSIAGKQLGDRDDRGALFWTTLDIMKKVLESNPNAKFLLENVKMKKEFEDYITTHTEKALGKVNKILINSALVSAQNRQRFYWTNIKDIEQPEDKNIFLKDIIIQEITDVEKHYCIDPSYFKETDLEYYLMKKRSEVVFETKNKLIKIGGIPGKNGKISMGARVYSTFGKSVTLTSLGGGWGAKTGLYHDDYCIRKLTPVECERLQNVPENYTDGTSNTQRYKMLGNGWTVDVIAHIFKSLKDIL